MVEASSPPAVDFRALFEAAPGAYLVLTPDLRIVEEGWHIRKDGSRFIANAVVTAIRDEKGGLRGFSKVTRDVTERKLAEAARIVERV